MVTERSSVQEWLEGTVWEIEGAITALLVRVPQALLEKVASEAERDGAATEIVRRLLHG